jgi:AcrR family transcriptional regulator
MGASGQVVTDNVVNSTAVGYVNRLAMLRKKLHRRTLAAPSPAPGRRLRRTAEAARREILDATERRLAELGPDGIRLQQIASDVGVSHPAILHHFGSREGLIAAVARRAVESLETDIITAISRATESGEPAALQVIEQAHRVLVEKGHARVLAWLMLSGHGIEPGGRVRAVAEVVHRRRREVPAEEDAEFEDTVFRILLVALAMFGEAVAGPQMRASAGISGDRATSRRFLSWLAGLITAPRG